LEKKIKMIPIRSKPALLLMVLLLELLPLACQKQNRLSPGTEVNIAQSARLAHTTAIEIMQNIDGPKITPDPVRGFFVTRVTITDKAVIDQFVGVLDQTLSVGLALACVPDYRLHFSLDDGATAQFDYLCSDDDPFFLGGGLSDHSFSLGGSVRLPGSFKELMDEQLRLAPELTPTPTVTPFSIPPTKQTYPYPHP
jgi:hypothetical protein